MAHPIYLPSVMIPGLISGAKTQIRIPCKPQPSLHRTDDETVSVPVQGVDVVPPWAHFNGPLEEPHPVTGSRTGGMYTLRCPYGTIGDRLWLRETWALLATWCDPETGYVEDFDEWVQPIPEEHPAETRWDVWYEAGMGHPEHRDDRGFSWRSPVTMPRWASRLNLLIMDLRVHRIKDIAEIDCEAELAVEPYSLGSDAYPMFQRLWTSSYGEESWRANPFVWALTVKKV